MPLSAGRHVPVGRIVGLYGVKGELKIESWARPHPRIFNYQPWQLVSKPDVAIEVNGIKGRVQGKRLICTWPGIEDRDKAAALVGLDIHVARQLLPCPDEGEYYWTDLEGLEVINANQVALGQVSHLFATGAHDVLVVKDGRRERLIPFVQPVYVQNVDLVTGTIMVNWDPKW